MKRIGFKKWSIKDWFKLLNRVKIKNCEWKFVIEDTKWIKIVKKYWYFWINWKIIISNFVKIFLFYYIKSDLTKKNNV